MFSGDDDRLLYRLREVIIHAHSHAGQYRRTQSGRRIRCGHPDRFPGYICFDLGPQPAVRSPSHSNQFLYPHSGFRRSDKIMLKRERRTFQRSPHHMSSGLVKSQAIEYTFGIRIPDRRALPGHIRQEDHTVASGRNLLRQCGQVVKGITGSQFLFKPAKDSASAYRTTLKKPQARHHMGAQNQLRVRCRPVYTDAHPSRLAALLLRLARQVYPCAQRPARRVQTSRYYPGPDRQAGLGRRLCTDCPDHFMAGIELRYLFHGKPHILRKFRVIAQCIYIEKMQSISLADLLGHHAGQLHPDITVALQKFICFFIDFRPLFFEPDHFRCGISRLESIARHPENPVKPDLLRHSPGNLSGSYIHPDRCVM